MAEEQFKFNPGWDKIDSTAKKVAEFEGGTLYEQNTVPFERRI